MKKNALVTYSGEPQLTVDDRLIIEHLNRREAVAEIVNRGLRAKPIGARRDAVVSRSCREISPAHRRIFKLD